jgi:hypothetical protein
MGYKKLNGVHQLYEINVAIYASKLVNIKAKAIGPTYIGAQVVKRILLEKKSIKKVLEIQNNETFDF